MIDPYSCRHPSSARLYAEALDVFPGGVIHDSRYRKIAHPGTFNANPLSAAAGVAALKIVESGEPQDKAGKLRVALRKEMNGVLDRRGVSGCVYGDLSMFHIYLGPCPALGSCDRSFCNNDPAALKAARAGAVAQALRRFMLVHGADIQGAGGMLSSAHTMDDVGRAVEIFDVSLHESAAHGIALVPPPGVVPQPVPLLVQVPDRLL